MARQLARRRQRERTAGVLVVALGVVVLVVALFALREPNGHVAAAQARDASNVAKHSSTTKHKSLPARARSSRATTSHTGQPVHRVPLIVLNNSTVQGLAAQAAHRFETGGWTVTSFGNLSNDIISTCAYYDPASADAKAAAEALQAQYPTIKRVEPKFAELPSGPVVVVLTGDYSAG